MRPKFASTCADWVAADLNGDGTLDLITDGGDAEKEIEIWFGNGDGTFQFSQGFAVSGLGSGFAVGDFNGDGALDFATAKVTSGRKNIVNVYLNNGYGTFQGPHIYEVSYAPDGIAAADVNGDGILDLVTGGLSVLLGNGDGTFRDNGGIQGSGGPPIAADFNADGKVDIVTAGTLVLLGNGDGTFQSPVATRGGVGGLLLSGDFMHNGALDLFEGIVLWQTEVNLLPTGMQFGNVNVGQSSQPQTATLTNASSNSVSISQILINGTDPQDYSQQNNCPASLAVNGSYQFK